MARVVNRHTQLRRRAAVHTIWLVFLCALLVALVANLGRSLAGDAGSLRQFRTAGVLQAASNVIIQPIVDVARHRYTPAMLHKWLFVGGHLLGLAIVSQLVWAPLAVINRRRSQKQVLRKLQQLPHHYWVLNDLRVPGPRASAQVDHVVVSPYGLWCIETKPHRGRVCGGEHDYQWTERARSQCRKRRTHQFLNPVRQNTTHCSYLIDYLRVQQLEAPVRSAIVFTDAELELMTMTPVETPETLTSRMLEMDAEVVLDDMRVQRIVESLTGLVAISPRTRRPAAAPDPCLRDAAG